VPEIGGSDGKRHGEGDPPPGGGLNSAAPSARKGDARACKGLRRSLYHTDRPSRGSARAQDRAGDAEEGEIVVADPRPGQKRPRPDGGDGEEAGRPLGQRPGGEGAGPAPEGGGSLLLEELNAQERLWRSVRSAPPARAWVPCPHPTAGLCSSPAPGARTVSVLAWHLSTSASIHRSTGGRVPDYLRWDILAGAAVSEIRRCAPGIALLQDVEQGTFVAMQRALTALGYEGYGPPGHVGQAVFFRASDFTHVHSRGCFSGAVLRPDARAHRGRPLEGPEEGAGAGEPGFWELLLEHDRAAPFCMVTLLREGGASGRPLCVVSAQLSPGGMRPEVASVHADLMCWTAQVGRHPAAPHARAAPACPPAGGRGGSGHRGDPCPPPPRPPPPQAVAQGHLTPDECEDLPVLIGGSLCMPAEVYRDHKHYRVREGAPPLRPGAREVLWTGRLPTAHIDHPNVRAELSLMPELGTHGLDLFSALAAADGGLEPPFTAMGPAAAGAAVLAPGGAEVQGLGAACASVDAIFATKRHFSVTRVLEFPFPVPPPGEGAAARDTAARPPPGLEPMPGRVWPSGHLAVGAEFAFSEGQA